MRLAFGILAEGRDANGRGTIARAVGQVHRRFVAGHQALVGVGGRIADGAERFGVLQNAADVIERHLGQARRIRCRRRAACPFSTSDLVRVHAGAVVAEERLGHEAWRFCRVCARRF